MMEAHLGVITCDKWERTNEEGAERIQYGSHGNTYDNT